MKFRLIIGAIIISTLISGCSQGLQEPPVEVRDKSIANWHGIAPGLIYTDLSINEKDLLIAKIDPKKFKLSIYQNKDPKKAKTIKEIHEATHSLLTFNGAYFTEDFKPTGLLISDGEQIRDINNASLTNGILTIDNKGNAQVLNQDAELNNIEFAIQNGPILIDAEGTIKIKKDDGNTASRTAISVDKKGNLILIVLKQNLLNANNAMSLYNFAHMIKNAPQMEKMNLTSVLNLDGGTSTGLMIDDKYYAEMEKVQNVIIIKER